MQNGFITLHRKIKDNPIWQNSKLVHLFIHLLLSANHEDKDFLFNGEVTKVKRGQLITGRYALAGETEINPRTIYDLLRTLERLGMITVKSNNKFSLITIVKYSDYQDKKTKSNNQPTTNQQPANTNNNDNNVNNDNKDTVATLWDKFQTNPLLPEIKQKYPDRDYKFYFQEMCDWWLANRKKLPKAISAYTQWLSRTKPDEAAKAERLRKLQNAETDQKLLEIASIPQNIGKLNELKARLKIKSI